MLHSNRSRSPYEDGTKPMTVHKTDVGDAAWLCELLECGLLRGSFVPPPVIRELRDLTRYRKRLIQAHSAECQRIHKTLEDASIRLGSVAADVLGVSGRAMLRALLAGERDPQVLAELARGRLRNRLPELRDALRGRFGAHHALLVRLALDHVEQLERSITELDVAVDRVIAPFAQARDRLDTITGVGKRAAETIIAEIGVDMGVFPTAGHLASWAGRCPGNNITGGKRRSGKPTKGNRWLGEVLTECAWAAARSRDSYLSAQFWRLARRIGKKKAAMAVGHSILVIAWHLLANDCDYQDLGGDYFVRRDADRARQRAVAQLQALGYQVTLQPLAA
jgi:transposase